MHRCTHHIHMLECMCIHIIHIYMCTHTYAQVHTTHTCPGAHTIHTCVCVHTLHSHVCVHYTYVLVCTCTCSHVHTITRVHAHIFTYILFSTRSHAHQSAHPPCQDVLAWPSGRSPLPPHHAGQGCPPHVFSHWAISPRLLPRAGATVPAPLQQTPQATPLLPPPQHSQDPPQLAGQRLLPAAQEQSGCPCLCQNVLAVFGGPSATPSSHPQGPSRVGVRTPPSLPPCSGPRVQPPALLLEVPQPRGPLHFWSLYVLRQVTEPLWVSIATAQDRDAGLCLGCALSLGPIIHAGAQGAPTCLLGAWAQLVPSLWQGGHGPSLKTPLGVEAWRSSQNLGTLDRRIGVDNPASPAWES